MSNQEQKNTQGKNYLQEGQYQEAITFYENQIEQKNFDNSDYYYLGCAYLLNGEIETAHSIWMSILLEVDQFEIELNNLLKILDEEGYRQMREGDLELALIVYQSLEELLLNQEENNPEYGVYYWHIGQIYKINSHFNLAEKNLQKAIDFAQVKDAYDYLGHIYFLNGMIDKTIQVYRQEIKDHPDYFVGYINLISALHKSGNVPEATKVAEEAEKIFPDDILWKIRNYLMLPSLYKNQQEMKTYRERYIKGLTIIEQELEQLNLEDEEVRKKALVAIYNNVNFELAYQCFNHKDLQKRYGQIVYKVVSANYPQWTQPRSNLMGDKSAISLNRKIRVGYVSRSMCQHVVSRLTLGWFYNHDRSLVEIYSYYIQDRYDDFTKEYQKNSDFFYHISGLEQVCEQIFKDKLDILVFLEIGMFARMTVLGSLRLAPIQCTTWAHPETTGLPTIDYFLSSDLMEPENAQEHYSEKLIRLPNIGISYAKPPIPEVSRTRGFFDLPEDGIIYFCSQSIFKYLPQHDYILATIAQKVPQSKFLFLTRPNPDLALQFKDRLALAFNELNLDINQYCVFLPPLIREEYLNLNLVSDVFLDSLGWSGGNTTLEAIACNLPVVTCPGEFMRGRHSYAILKMLGVTDTIASSEDEYIEIAVRLGLDQTWREEIKEKIQANHHNLYDDLECVRALENFYQDVVKNNKSFAK
ncbi:hypothetical protein VKI21_17450 [Cyanobacterium aponinum UTEX 3222]|uniref:O-linked N-acetylglucosamine transferase, SPINDLY family protein n=1 Tax=Cyanobacterium aponinum TaxID=379064 RepID=UPI0030884162|nr:hypothetical protein VKI21_17450 [Cyanobacterium aponinum UTEX 3222]